MFKGNQLLDSTIMASLAILLSNARVTQMHRMPVPKVRVIATKVVAIRSVVVAMVMVMVMVMGRPIVRPMLWMPTSSRSICLIYLKGINQNQLVIMSIVLIRLSQKTEFRSFSL